MACFRICGRPSRATGQKPADEEHQQEQEGADETYLDDGVEILIVSKEIYVRHEYTEARAEQGMRRNKWRRIGESRGARGSARVSADREEKVIQRPDHARDRDLDADDTEGDHR